MRSHNRLDYKFFPTSWRLIHYCRVIAIVKCIIFMRLSRRYIAIRWPQVLTRYCYLSRHRVYSKRRRNMHVGHVTCSLYLHVLHVRSGCEPAEPQSFDRRLKDRLVKVRTWRTCLNHNNSINYLRAISLRNNNRSCGLPRVSIYLLRLCDCVQAMRDSIHLSRAHAKIWDSINVAANDVWILSVFIEWW